MLQRLCVAIEFTGSLAESHREQQIEYSLVDQDGQPIGMPTITIPLRLIPLGPDAPNTGTANVVLEMTQVALPHYGTFSVMAFQGGTEVARVPFTVMPHRPRLPAST